MRVRLRSLAAHGALLLVASTLPACNTVKAAGKDIEALGENMSELADEASD